jgi:hypothetical protein
MLVERAERSLRSDIDEHARHRPAGAAARRRDGEEREQRRSGAVSEVAGYGDASLGPS